MERIEALVQQYGHGISPFLGTSDAKPNILVRPPSDVQTGITHENPAHPNAETTKLPGRPLHNPRELSPPVPGRAQDAPRPEDSVIATPLQNYGGPNLLLKEFGKRGVVWVEERMGKPGDALDYEDGLSGTRYSLDGKKLVPALQFDNPNPRGRNIVRFDGLDSDDSHILIDRKFSLTTKSKQIADIRRWGIALSQNKDYKVRIEVPDERARAVALKLLRLANANKAISVEVSAFKADSK